MGGGLMQLVAYGAQDIYLTGNPQITFFKAIYKRHTNFSVESIPVLFSGDVAFGKKTSCTIPRNGDLIHNMYIECEISNTGEPSGGEFKPFNNRPGHSMLDYVEIEIGGQCIDKHYGEWMDLWCQISHNKEQWAKLDRIISGDLPANSNSLNRKLYVPLHFWFNRNPGLALPLIALQYHEVKLNVMFKQGSNIQAVQAGGGNGGDISPGIPKLENICLFCDYIYLDTDERRRFAQVSHEYLIEQVQFNGKTQIGTKPCVDIKLNLNHPVKEIVWVVQNMGTGGSDPLGIHEFHPFTYCGSTGIDTVTKAVLQLNGNDRFITRECTYFRLVQPYQHHTGGFDHSSVSGGLAGMGSIDGFEEKGFYYVYSFAIKPEEHQPSGTCNFSRIDSAILYIELEQTIMDNKQARVYATNYNVLRIMSGMGGLAYSN